MEFFGFLLFLLHIHGVRVSRCITSATLAHATGRIPSNRDDGAFSQWEADFQAMRLSAWKVLKQLQVDDPIAQDMALKHIIDNDAWAEALWQPAMALKPGEGFRAAAEGLMRARVYATLFEDIAKMGESLRTGFNWALVSLQVKYPYTNPSLGLMKRNCLSKVALLQCLYFNLFVESIGL